VREVVKRFWPFFFYAGLFSLAVNLLLLVPPLYMLQLFDRVISSRSEETLVMLSLGAVFALMVMALLDALRARLLTACGVAIERKLGARVLGALLAQTARLSGTAELNGLRDVNTLRQFLVGPGILAVFDAPWLPLFLLLIYVFHPVLGAVALGGALLMIAIAVANERLTRASLERTQSELRRAGQFVDTSARNAELVSALGMLPAVTRRWSGLNDAALREQVEASATGGTFSALTKFARQAIQMAMLAAGAWLVITHQATSGVMIAATIILGRALAPVEMLVAGWRTVVDVRSAWKRLDTLLKNTPEAAAGTELPRPAGELSVERVAFALPRTDRPILRGVAFRLAPGESLGVIGPSAAGKSTLARLLVGVWKPLSGAVRLDGADVAGWQREHLGPYVGYLPQHVELFSGTVAENISRLAEPDAAAVIRAAQRASVHEMLLRLPRGYDTEVGEGGAALSPGQRQCVALARALYSPMSGSPRLVVLDEPNANMDVDGEAALMRALQALKQDGVTVVIVAHRPALLAGVDKLLVLKQGQVELFGPREEVMHRVTRVVHAARGAA
jgi:PrtD family type I secretion system ABC transporter